MSYKETYEELFLSRFVFVRALGAVIPEGKGVFLVFDEREFPIQRLIVHNTNDIISVLDAQERTDLKHGDWVVLIDEDSLKN